MAAEVEWADGQRAAASPAAGASSEGPLAAASYGADDSSAKGSNDGPIPRFSVGQAGLFSAPATASSTLDLPWTFRGLGALQDEELPAEPRVVDPQDVNAAVAAAAASWAGIGPRSQSVAPVVFVRGASSEETPAARTAGAHETTAPASAPPSQFSGALFIAPGPSTEDRADNAQAGPVASGSTTTFPASVLYLNFDGVYLSPDDLARWSQDWSLSGDALDPAGQGIRVDPFLQGTPGWQQREAVIATMLDLLEADLAPFGVQVRRHEGAAVEGLGATTIFLGRTSTYTGHLAGDIDRGNDNRTDIAFVANEWWGNPRDTAYALADVTLHEAGHTYGLVHVDVRQGDVLFPDTMGLRYSAGQDQWARDTSFVDRTFVEFGQDGGGVRFQNSYQAMREIFGLGGQSALKADLPFAAPDGTFNLMLTQEARQVEIHHLGPDTTQVVVGGREFVLGEGLVEIRLYTTGGEMPGIVATGETAVQVTVDRWESGRPWPSETIELGASQAATSPWVAGHLEGDAAAPNASPCGCPFCAGTLWQTQWA